MTTEDRIRVTHHEREAAVEELRTAYAVGCLDDNELEERIGCAYAAKTRGELAAVVSDLPVMPAAGPVTGPPGPAADDRAEAMRHSVVVALWLMVGALGAWLIAVADGGIAAVPLIFLWLVLLQARGRLPQWFRHVAASILISKVSPATTGPVPAAPHARGGSLPYSPTDYDGS